jgi:hypothetical protein
VAESPFESSCLCAFDDAFLSDRIDRTVYVRGQVAGGWFRFAVDPVGAERVLPSLKVRGGGASAPTGRRSGRRNETRASRYGRSTSSFFSTIEIFANREDPTAPDP